MNARKRKPAAKKATKSKAVKPRTSKAKKTTKKKPATKKTVAKKPVPKKSVAKKPTAAAKPASKKPVAKKPAVKKVSTAAKPASKKPQRKKKPTVKRASNTKTSKKRKSDRPTGQTMRVPAPTTDVLLSSALPDVSRAGAALARQEEARGHLRPTSSHVGTEYDPGSGATDGNLIMSSLAVDLPPRMEDNYDYSVVSEFEESPWCPRPTRMVNTGCGGGEAAVFYAKRGFQCVGIDSDRAAVGLARERAWLAGVEIDFMVGDLFETPNLLPAESFGLAMDRGAFYGLTEVRERQRYLANIHRLLFQGGVLYLSAGFFPIAPEKRRSRSRKAETDLLMAHEGGVVVHELERAGFEMVHRVLRPTVDSGEFGELLLYLRKP